MNTQKLELLVLEALQTETGGVRVYDKALECVDNSGLRAEWRKYRDQTERHREVLLEACAKLGIDPNRRAPSCDIVRATADSLVGNMDVALQSGDRALAQIVAAEAILQAKQKDHLNWQLIELAAKEAEGRLAKILKDARDEVEDQQDEHLFHSMRWARELWTESLGIKCVLSRPEEKADGDPEEMPPEPKARRMM